MRLLEAIPILRDLPPLATVALLAMVPVVELRGAVPLGLLVLDQRPLPVFIAAVAGNLAPVPALIWWLEPVQRWLARRFSAFRKFFAWLFARTRRRHSATYDRLRDLAVIAFVAIPLPGTGAWTGCAAVFVFGVPKWRALGLVAAGVLLAGVAVTLLVASGQAFLAG